MCGLSGWLLRPGVHRAQEYLVASANSLDHRGPDNRGYFYDPQAGVGLAHNRLSIIDLSPEANQPFYDEGRNHVLVYNGELYNFAELREQLERLGHRFHTRSDTEVVLRAFLAWGKECLGRFAGMFALALWSTETRTLLLARDPSGMKPLYYARLPNGAGISFASEVKAFTAAPDFTATVNRAALDQYLEFGFTFDEHETVLEGVRKVPPGNYLEIVRGECAAPRAYYTPPVRAGGAAAGAPAAAAAREELLADTLYEVIDQHLVADVPVGLLLSGGLDSSLVAAIASRSRRITTLSMGFSGSAVDERPMARKVSEHIGSDHLEVTVEPSEIVGSVEETAWYVDDLFGDWGTISTRSLYKKCREVGLKVVLVGEGADELFGGYTSFRTAQGRGPVAWRLFQLYRRYSGRRYGKTFPKFAALMRSHLRRTGGDLFAAVRLFESRDQLPNNYVMKVDKASMSASVEARAPFLDWRITRVAYETPAALLQDGGTNKMLLRSMAERYNLLPPEIIHRPKFGAGIASNWMDDSQEFRAFARGVILDRRGWLDELGLRNAMRRYFDHDQSGYSFPHAISIFSDLAWRLLLLNLWSRRYLGA